MNIFVEEVNRKLSRWIATPPRGKIGETVERMCSEMHARYGKDSKVTLRISGRDYRSGEFRSVCSEKIRLKKVTYGLIGRLVVDGWHLKPKDALFELTLHQLDGQKDHPRPENDYCPTGNLGRFITRARSTHGPARQYLYLPHGTNAPAPAPFQDS